MYSKIENFIQAQLSQSKVKVLLSAWICSKSRYTFRNIAAGFIHTRVNECQVPYLNEPVFSIK